MTRIPIIRYNNHNFENLVYDITLQVLFYKNREIPWRVTKITSFSKKKEESKSYVYQSVVIRDVGGVKRKIFRDKLEKNLLAAQPQITTPPTETQPEKQDALASQPTETSTAETPSTETQPAEIQPTETQPTETKPTETPAQLNNDSNSGGNTPSSEINLI
jgi:hypothetical protein